MYNPLRFVVSGAACAVMLGSASAQAEVFAFDTNLVQHHTFDTDISDAFGRGASSFGTTAIDGSETAVGAGALRLVGTGYVDLDTKGALDGLANSTVSVWVNAESIATFTGIFTADGWGGSHLHLNLVEQTVSVPGPAVQVAAPLITPLDGTQWPEFTVSEPTGWIHIAVVTTGSNVKLYVNGNEEDSTDNLTGPLGLGLAGAIGGYANDAPGRNFNGWIDDFRIYDVALTPEQVSQIAVPEPGSLAITGLAALMMFKRRRHN